jgi:electron transfer flavoprotein beta subunit
MAAKKIQVDVRPASGEPTGGGRVRWHLPEEPPTSSEVVGEGPEAAPAVVDLLQKLGVLR